MSEHSAKAGHDDKAGPVSRRKLLKRGLLGSVAVGAGLLGYTVFVEPFWWRFVRAELPIRDLPNALVGRTLVQISDLHLGSRVDEDHMREAVMSLASLSPDLVVITGDLTQHGDADGVAQVRRVFRDFPHGPLGSISILGNHDYGRGWSEPKAAAAVETALQDSGVRVLRNELETVEGLQIVGLDDLWAKRFDPARVMPRVDPAAASLVLSHNPDTLDLPVWGDWKGWVLSGHTHGGQCKPPFLPPPLLPVKNRRYTQGAIDAGGGRRVYINPGLGYLRQVRFNVRPEITVFTLRRG